MFDPYNNAWQWYTSYYRCTNIALFTKLPFIPSHVEDNFYNVQSIQSIQRQLKMQLGEVKLKSQKFALLQHLQCMITQEQSQLLFQERSSPSG